MSIQLLSEYSIMSPVLNITRVNRGHMGLYMCIASNGISPSANQTFNLEVHCKYTKKSIIFIHHPMK